MDSKLNYEAIENYSTVHTKAVLDRHFSTHATITGHQILNLSSARQVNLFIVKLLFEQWHNEIKKFKSPYFDYKAPEVIIALDNFQNTLSRHISVDREHIEPLVKKAVGDALLLVLSPYHYFHNELNKEGEKMVNVKKLKASEKFIKVNAAIYHTLIEKIEKVSPDTVSNDIATDLLNHVLEETEVIPEDANEYVVKLSETAPLNIQEIYMEEQQEVKEEVVEEAPVAQEQEPQLFEEQALEHAPEPIQNPEPEESKEPEIQPESEEIEETLDDPAGEDEQEINIVGDKEPSPEAKTTLNDTFQQEGKKTLADIHQDQKIASIENAITLNQRFMFVNTLFDGDIDQFNKTIIKLDSMENMTDANEYLDRHFQDWDSNDDEVKEFMEIVGRRFG